MTWLRNLIGAAVRKPAITIGILASALVVVGATVTLFTEGTRVRYASIPRIEQTIPSAFAETGAGMPQDAVIDETLLGDGPFGRLPAIGPDGRRSLDVYAHPAAPNDGGARVAILLTGVGLRAALTEEALALPGEISLQFSPYAPALRGQVTAAREAGHEVLLGLPLEPPDYPDSDPGPHTLLADASPAENNLQLAWILSRAEGYIGVAGEGGRFADSDVARPALRQLRDRGLGLVEIGGDRLQQVAESLDLPYLPSGPPIDDEPSGLAIDYALAALESRALATGAAIGVGELYPVTLERLRAWLDTLDSKGLRLAPVSALLIGPGDLATGVDGSTAGDAAARG